MRVRGLGCAAHEHRFFVLGECPFDVVGVRGDRLSQFGAVEHGQVRTLTRTGPSGAPRPPRSVTPGTRSHRCSSGSAWIAARNRSGFAISDQRREFRCPTVELGRDPRCRSGGVGEIDTGKPLRRTVQLNVGVHDVSRLSMRGDRFSWCGRVHRPVPDGFGCSRMLLVDVVEVGLDERGADVFRLRIGEQRPDLRPGTVCTPREGRWSLSNRRRRSTRGDHLRASAQCRLCVPIRSCSPEGNQSGFDGGRRAAPRDVFPCRRRVRRGARRTC